MLFRSLSFRSDATTEKLKINSNGVIPNGLTASTVVFTDANGALSSTGTVTTDKGGTGLSSYTAGDLTYYASGTAFTKLAIGASGRYLSSSGTAPQWNAPAALTKTDDTNVTLTLGGSASTALLNAASLTLGWTGQLSLGRGGTNANLTASAGSVAYSTASAIAFTAVGSANQVLISNGTSAPSWSNLSSLGVSSFSAGTTGFTPSTATTGAVTLAGTLATTNGGTGLTSFTANGVLYASSTSALTSGSALTWNGSTFKADTGTSGAVFQVEPNAVNQLLMSNYGGAGYQPFLLAASDWRFLTGTAGGGSVTETMRLTSTGLGIGTSSPTAKLFVAGGITNAESSVAGMFSSANQYGARIRINNTRSEEHTSELQSH